VSRHSSSDMFRQSQIACKVAVGARDTSCCLPCCLYCLRRVPCYHGIARSQVEVRGVGLQIRRVAYSKYEKVSSLAKSILRS
jgi:hypothetical protein